MRAAFCDAHPDRTVVVYANTSAAVKARADWMVTSSIALPIVKYLHERGENPFQDVRGISSSSMVFRVVGP